MGNTIKIIMPAGAMGANEFDTALDSFLRLLAIKHAEEGEWAEKYGATINNDIMVMHKYCWCEQDNCPWCMGCNCPESATHFMVDDKEVSHDDWSEFFMKETYDKAGVRRDRIPVGEKHCEWMRLADEANLRRTVKNDKVCEYCRGERHKEYGAGAGQAAPNFWYKPLDFKVWWYKYIGRDTKTNKNLSKKEFNKMVKNTLGILTHELEG